MFIYANKFMSGLILEHLIELKRSEKHHKKLLSIVKLYL